MRVLLDVNVILDSLLQRAPWNTEADAILHAAAAGHVTCYSTTLSLATIFYVGRKVIGTARARGAIRMCLTAFTLLPIDRATLVAADAFPGDDFEDNILMAAGVAASLDAIVTRNPTDFARSPLLVLGPSDLLARLPPISSSTTPP